MEGHRILVVEDDPDQRAGLADILRADGYHVAEAESAERALEILQSQPVDLLISDYQLGGATGTWLARIAALALYPSSPRALLVTGHDNVPDAEGLTVLHKPLDVPRFLAEVRQVLGFDTSPEAGASVPAQRIAFILYVSDSLSSRRTEKALRALFSRYEEPQIALTTVDIATGDPHQAEEHRIVVTPTLVKTFPAPRVWIAGEFRHEELVERLLAQAGVEART